MRGIDLVGLFPLYSTSLSVRVVSGEATLSARLTEIEGELGGEVSLALVGLKLAPIPGSTLFGLSPEISAGTIEGINRYAAELPIVFAFAVDGEASSPQLHWEKPLLQIAREGLIMEGNRAASSLVEERLNALAPGKEVPLAGDFEKLASEVKERAEAIIRGGTGEPPDITDALNELFKSLIPQQEEE